MSEEIKPPKSSPVIIVGACFVLGNLAIFIVESLKGLQIKSHSPPGLDSFDFSIIFAGCIGCVAINIAAFMNQSYSRLKDARDKHDTEMSKRTETDWIRQELDKTKVINK
jgi:hypothetical protein